MLQADLCFQKIGALWKITVLISELFNIQYFQVHRLRPGIYGLCRVIQKPNQTSKIELFVKVVNIFQLLDIFTKSSISAVWLASEWIFGPFLMILVFRPSMWIRQPDRIVKCCKFYKFHKSLLYLTLKVDTCKKHIFIEESGMIQEELSQLIALRQPNQKIWPKILAPYFIIVISIHIS